MVRLFLKNGEISWNYISELYLEDWGCLFWRRKDVGNINFFEIFEWFYVKEVLIDLFRVEVKGIFC